MEIKLENLELLPKILQKLEIIEEYVKNTHTKRWLNTNELAEYLGYSKDRVYKIKDELVEGVHFHKKGKILFDRIEIDKWITEGSIKNEDSRKIVSSILDSVIKKHTR